MSSVILTSQHQIDHLRSMILSLGSDPVSIFKNTLLPSIKRSKFKYLGAAIALYVASRVYQAFAYPRKFRHLKRVPVLPMIKSLIAADSDLEQAKKFMLPRWKETNGMISFWGQFGWEVNVSNPEAVRTILYKTGMCEPRHRVLAFLLTSPHQRYLSKNDRVSRADIQELDEKVSGRQQLGFCQCS
jgi:hypothetical protein